MNILICVIILMFVIGMIYNLTVTNKKVMEGFKEHNCPNLLVKKDGKFYLVNKTNKWRQGSNPYEFDNLEEYAEFVEEQQKNGSKCPVLYYEQTYDAQNKIGYRMLSDPFEKDAGMPSYNEQVEKREPRQLRDAHRDDPPYNQNNYAGFDGDDQQIGVLTPLDLVGDTSQPSGNPMASNWGGHKVTHNQLLAGKHKGRIRNDYD